MQIISLIAAMNDLPGAELLEEALDLTRPDSVSISACLLSMAKVRLERGGFKVPAGRGDIVDPELTLYRLLRTEGGDAFSRYNALIRRLVSFERAWEKRAVGGRKENAIESGTVAQSAQGER